MKSSGKFEKYIVFSIFSNIVTFNTLAGSGKKNGKGCCGSNKDKKTSVDNQNDTDNNNKDNNDPKSEEQNEEEKKKKKEELEKEKQNLNEQEKLRQNIETIKIKFNELKNNYDKLKSSNKNYFKIDSFSITITETDIKGITKENINNIETKLNSEVDNFNKALKDQFDVLNKKFEDLKNNNNSSGGDKYDTSDIENTLKNKENITVDSFISLDTNLKVYESALTGSLDTFKSTVISSFDKEENKKLFELANKIQNTFNNDLEAKINSLSRLNSFKEIQDLQKQLSENLKKCNEIINNEKEKLKNDITTANINASNINNKLLLNKLGIELKVIEVIDKLTNVTEYETITKNLTDLQTKIAAIQGNLTEFLKDNFVENLLTKTGWDLIEEAEKFYDFITNFKGIKMLDFKNLGIKNNDEDIDNLINTINFKLNGDDNIYIILSEEKEEGGNYLYKFYEYKKTITDFKKKTTNEDALKKDYVDSKKCKLSIYTNINCKDINKIIFKKKFIKEKEDNSEIIFLLLGGKNFYIFYSQSNGKCLGNLITDDDFRYSIKKIKILYNSDNFENFDLIFYDFKNLEELNIDNLNTTNANNMANMFYGCENLKILTFGDNFNTEKVTNMNKMFRDCYNLGSLDLSKFNTSYVTNMGEMFNNCKVLNNLTFGDNFNTENVINMSDMFNGCSALESLDLSKFNTNNVNNMEFMFCGCNNLAQIKFSFKFSTEKVTKMGGMFEDCKKLTNLDLNNFNTENVTDMKNMFRRCGNLTSLYLTNFNTAKVTDMREMFSECINLTGLDLTSFNTENVTNMSYMFKDCKNLTSLYLGSFNTKNVTNMSNMFEDCKKLTSLDLSNFNTENVNNISYMFKNCVELENITCSENFVEKGTLNDGVFDDCNISKEFIKNFEGGKY